MDNWWIGPKEPLEQLAARFERNAADWRKASGDSAPMRAFEDGQARAWSQAADEVRRVLRGDPDYYDMDDEEKHGALPGWSES